MSILRKAKDAVKLAIEKCLVYRQRRAEILKFKDPERVKINESVELTKEQEAAIDKLYLENYGSKIPYTWHKNFMAHSGRFDAKYFPELLFIPEFEHFMNSQTHYAKVLADKNVVPFFADAANVRTPKVILSSSCGMLRDAKLNKLNEEEAVEIIKNVGKVFIKPSVDSCSGRGCFVANFKEGRDDISGKVAVDLLRTLGGDFVIQECVVCHSSISEIYSGAVNTFRIITYRWKDEIIHMPVIMRIGRGGNFVDNAHAGGMFIAVDDNGMMHEKAITEFNLQFTHHPDTNVEFGKVRIPLVAKAIDAAKRMHAAVPQIGVVNWDLTIDSSGDAVLIEANTLGGSVWLPQMAHGCGPFGEHTEEVLQWLKLMKSVKPQQRKQYAFGKIATE